LLTYLDGRVYAWPPMYVLPTTNASHNITEISVGLQHAT